jgi:hypothetical protein
MHAVQEPYLEPYFKDVTELKQSANKRVAGVIRQAQLHILHK